MTVLTFLAFVAGFFLLVGGAELLVRGASRLAAAAGISPLVVGLTVVAYGTSAPEAAVSIQATLAQPPRPDIALGNIVGSNIANLLLVLGASSLVAPLAVSRSIVTKGMPLVVGVSLATLAMAWVGGSISRMDGLTLFGGALLYTVLAIRGGRRQPGPTTQSLADEAADPTALPPRWHLLLDLAMLLIGLGLLVWGSDWLVHGASVIARAMGVSELMIGLTIVAVGTSLPEIATSVVATIRDQRDIAVGNVVGSNLFNLLLVLGLAGVVAPDGVPVSPQALKWDLPVMVGVALLAWPICWTDYRISRLEGLMFLAFFVLFAVQRYMQDTGHPDAPTLTWAVLICVVPCTTMGLLYFCLRFARSETLGSTPEIPS